MPDRIVVDSSVVAKFLFLEDGWPEAEVLITSGMRLLAPELLFTEIASVAAKKVRRGLATRNEGREAIASISDLIDDVVPLSRLANRAFLIATDTGCSAYDATYLVVAQDAAVPVVTADMRLVIRARDSGLGHLVRPL